MSVKIFSKASIWCFECSIWFPDSNFLYIFFVNYFLVYWLNNSLWLQDRLIQSHRYTTATTALLNMNNWKVDKENILSSSKFCLILKAQSECDASACWYFFILQQTMLDPLIYPSLWTISMKKLWDSTREFAPKEVSSEH